MRRHFGIRFVICQFLFSGCLGAAVTLAVSPSSISLSGLASSNTPITSYSARVTATGTGSGALTVSTTPAFSWLSAWASSPTIAAGRGAVVIAVSADPGNGDLNTGTNSGSVTITSGTSSVTIKVTFSISSPPATISADQTCLAFSATLGGSSPATQALHVDSSNGLSVGLTATASTSSGGSWLKVSPGSTSTSATLTVTATVGALSANTYNGAIQIKPANGTSTLNVPVTMTVAATGSRGSLRIDGGCSTTLVFNESAGSTSPDARSAQLTATGTGVINFTVSPPSASWITSVSTTASDGTKVTKVTGGGPAVTVTVTVTPAGKQLVSDSPLTATVTISGDSGPPVTIIVVLTSQGTDIFASLPAPFSPLLAGQQSDANNIVVTTTNNNGTSVSVTPSTQDGAKWLVANSSNSKSNVNVPGTISVVVDAGSLRPGTYNGSVKLECQGAPCVPVLVTLTVTVTPPPNLMSDQSSLTFAAILGGSPPTAKALQISASDGSALNFTLSPTTTGGTNWLAATSSRISTPAAVNVTATLGSLTAGTYNGSVSIQVSPSNGSQPLSIPVTFTVSPQTTIAASPTTLSFSAAAGSSAQSQTVNLTASGGAALGFTISTTPPNGTSWLGVTASGNSTPVTITVFASAVGQGPGLYSGSIQIKPNNGSAAVAIPITFTVSAPSMAVDTSPISLTAQPGSSTCSQKSLAVKSSDSITAIAFQGSTSVSTPSGGSWLLLTPNSGTTPATLTVTCTAAGLSAGSYSGTVSLAIQNSTSAALSIPVALTVSGAAPATTVATISHVADGGGWTTTIILVNTDSVPAAFTLKLFGDDGKPLVTSLTGLGFTGTVTDTIPVGGSRTIHTDGIPANLLTGWAQISSSQSVNGTAIFRLQTAGQEAAVPLLAAGSQHLMFPFDNNSGLATGVALAASGAAQNVPVSYTLRGQGGQTVSLEPPVSVAANGHTSFVLPVRSSAAQDLRGVAQFDSQGGPIFGLGIRSNQGAFTSVEAVVQASASVKTISHIADSGGWKTTIILVNTDTVPAVFTVNFWRDDGTPFGVSLVGAGVQSTVTGTIQPGGTQTIETSNSGSQLITGWAEVVSSQSLGGTAIFASGGQEAAVPLLSSGSARLVLPFDNSGSLVLGVALANPNATQDTTVSVTLRNENGVVISNEPSISLPRHSHTSFVLPVRSTNPQDIRGVVEFDSSNGNIYVLGIRGNNGAFTSVRALNK